MAAPRVTISLPLEDHRTVACPAPSRQCPGHAACMGASKITSGQFSTGRSPRSCHPSIAEVSSAPLSRPYLIMDPLSICASAANVAQLCGTIIKSLYKFCDDASNVDATVEGFRIETTNLQQTLVNVESTRKTSLARNIQSLELKHWGHVNSVLKRCWKTLLKLEAVLDRCASAQGIGRMPKTQIRLNMQSHSINILRKHMKSYTQALQVSLQTISIVTQWQNHDSIQGAISVLSERIEEVRVTLSARHIGRGVEDVDEGLSEADMQEEAEAVADVEKIIISAENVGKVTSTSSYCPDDESILGRNQFAIWLDSIPNANTRRISSNLDENRSIRTIESDSIPPDKKVPADSGIGSDATTDYDPEPETEDHFSAPVNATIVARFKDAVKQEMEAGHYQRAEASQLSLIKHLEEGQTKHGIAYDRAQVQEDLARIYHKEKRLDEAKAIYNRLISDKKDEKEKTTEVWRWYYCLAKIYQEQDKLQYAETFAKRSYRGRENSLGEDDPLVVESVALLTQIYQQKQEHTLAKGLREYYLRDYQLPRREEIAAPEPSIGGSSDMPWPADACYDIASPAFDPYKAMRYATEHNNDIAVEDILRGTRDNKRQELATKALQWAIKAGHCKVASLLIELNVGIRKDSRFLEGKTPLIHAIEERNEEMVQEFLRIGANLEVRCDKVAGQPCTERQICAMRLWLIFFCETMPTLNFEDRGHGVRIPRIGVGRHS
ncbi:uncharacterized protein K452DRAFT_44571 [Aplosporella prunicola CBS 121167]|uniref:Uncharacterized protein n=1 Tax=Aplosporella prunicola CBS 121167 TaxID=1176127 RepID=A0A6A6BA32_9PEZI|nr:uncharacterized protein K452DRAFT_44571 [Aplosporella prunicola CBS 121167]KAF2141059.1 hypothetical protein K452DRAFT_44571 [Aplosporella prunicola CBS 121167]